MKIAIIGGSGRAGREISAELARRGHQVTAISRHPENAVQDAGVTAVAGDVKDAAALSALLAGHDVVVSAVMFADTDPAVLGKFINTVMEGMSVQARDGATINELLSIAKMALDRWPAAI